MWKDFFYYSKSERRAVYVLMVLLALLVVALVLIPDSRSPLTAEENGGDFVKQAKPTTENSPTDFRKTPVVLAPFNPNIADSIELSRLGLPPYVVRNVLKYRAKGGKFRTPEAFARIYGLTEEKFAELKPYIRIPAEPVLRKAEVKDTVRRDTVVRSFKYPEGTLVDVATADTTELKKIPGIGSGIAKAIVGYRTRLGGFYSLEQLREIKYITPELMKWFKLEEVPLRKIAVNRASLEQLRAHPYLNFYQAKVIVEHRRKKGEIKSLSRLSLYEEFTEKDLERLSNYLSFD